MSRGGMMLRLGSRSLKSKLTQSTRLRFGLPSTTSTPLLDLHWRNIPPSIRELKKSPPPGRFDFTSDFESVKPPSDLGSNASDKHNEQKEYAKPDRSRLGRDSNPIKIGGKNTRPKRRPSKPGDEHAPLPEVKDERASSPWTAVSLETAGSDLGFADGSSQVSGMKVSLKPHQVQGVHWMLDRETRTDVGGGILADANGLGKTIQALALILLNPSSGREKRGTLIVVSSASDIPHWTQDIICSEITDTTTTSGLGRLYKHHGKNRLRLSQELGAFDVVITTYATLARDQRLFSPITWHRVILAEGHQIRNPKCLVSRAVCSLESRHRWILTGTPLHNGVTDTFGYFRFLKVRGLANQEPFTTTLKLASTLPWEGPYPKFEDTEISSRLVAPLLRDVLLRRLNSFEIDGKPILILPERTLVKEGLAFSELELDAYNTTGNDVGFHLSKMSGLLGICSFVATDKSSSTSTKVTRALQILREWEEAAPNEKTVIFANRLGLIDLLESRLKEAGFSSRKYTGKTKNAERSEVLRELSKEGGPSVLVMGIHSSSCAPDFDSKSLSLRSNQTRSHSTALHQRDGRSPAAAEE